MKVFLTLAIALPAISLSACVTEQQPEKMTDAVVEQTTGIPDWQSTLIDDLQTVEGKGDVFLDGAFKLYDQLLSEEPLTAARKAAIDDVSRRAPVVMPSSFRRSPISKATLRARTSKPPCRSRATQGNPSTRPSTSCSRPTARPIRRRVLTTQTAATASPRFCSKDP